MNIVALNSSKNWGGNERWLTTALNGLSIRGHQIYLIKRHKTDHWNSLNSSINVLEAPFTNELSIKTTVRSIPSVKIVFHYETFNQAGSLLNNGEVTLVFVNTSIGKPCSAPTIILDKFYEILDL